jgi:hypothetical protein
MIVYGKNRSEPFVAPTATVWTVASMVAVLLNKKRDRNVSMRKEALRSDNLRGMIHLSRRASKKLEQRFFNVFDYQRLDG